MADVRAQLLQWVLQNSVADPVVLGVHPWCVRTDSSWVLSKFAIPST